MTRPLDGVKVLDFSTLLPGPLATLILAEAGAEVIKVERPPDGDELRRNSPEFAILNRGKRSVALDLKDPAARGRLAPLLREADVLVEQFRPGVMERLGLGWDDVRAVNPRLIYCSINGYGSEGPKAQASGHDLTYAAEAGLLARTCGADGSPGMPPALIADIGGGSYPAVINILMALLRRERTGEGARIEVAMYDNLFPFLFSAFSQAYGRGDWPEPGAGLETGGSPRYNIYPTADGRHLAAAPMEAKFWAAFCDAIDLPEAFRGDDDWPATRAAVAERIASRTAAEWEQHFEGRDFPAAIVLSFEEALGRSAFRRASPARAAGRGPRRGYAGAADAGERGLPRAGRQSVSSGAGRRQRAARSMTSWTPRDPDFQADVRRRFAASPVCGFFGFEVKAVEPGEITLALPLKPELGHAPGFFQGSIVGAVAEYAGSYAAYTLLPADWSRLTLDYTLKFLGPARGERLIGKGRVLAHGRTLSNCAADLFVLRDGAEHLCATALVTVRHTPPGD